MRVSGNVCMYIINAGDIYNVMSCIDAVCSCSYVY